MNALWLAMIWFSLQMISCSIDSNTTQLKRIADAMEQQKAHK